MVSLPLRNTQDSSPTGGAALPSHAVWPVGMGVLRQVELAVPGGPAPGKPSESYLGPTLPSILLPFLSVIPANGETLGVTVSRF